MNNYISMFFIYSFLGYMCEVIFCTIINKKLSLNRGFFIGPYLPIYGAAGVLIYYFTHNLNNILIISIIITILASLIEYLTSYILEKIYGVRWWDYSEKPFNIGGRICLENIIVFLVLGLVAVYLLNPLIFKLFHVISNKTLTILNIIICLIFISDFILTITALAKIDLKHYQIYSDSTNKLKQEIFKIIKLKHN